MDSHELFIFKHVAESNSISKTAEKLSYVQSNISQRIKNLEEELGVRLFKRNNRGVTITSEGEILLDYANQILQLINEAKIKINPEKWKEHLVIGATQTISALKVPRILSSFLSVNHQINVKVRTDTTRSLIEQVIYGEIDGGFVSESFENKELKTVYTILEKICLISPKNRMNNELLPILVNSNSNCVYRKTLINLFKNNSKNNLRIIEFDSLEAILQSVCNGLGVSLVPSDVAQLNYYQNEYMISELLEPIQIDFVIKNKNQKPNGLKSFIKFLKEEKTLTESI